MLDPGDAYEPYAWADVERAPLEVAIAGGELPEGVYRPHTAVPDRRVRARRRRTERTSRRSSRCSDRPVEHVQFDGNDVAQARALGAAHGENWHAVIVGDDVATQLVTDYLARTVKELRKRAREERKLARDAAGLSEQAIWRDAVNGHAAVAGTGNGAAVDPEEARRAEREAERQAREAGNTVQPRARPGDLHDPVAGARRRARAEAARLGRDRRRARRCRDARRALRVPRLGHRDHAEERQDEVRLPREAGGRPASQRLPPGASKPGEIAGRQLALLAMATYADQNAVAASSRSWHHVKASGPWAADVDELLDKLVADNLPDRALSLLAPVLEARKAEQAGTRPPPARRARRPSHDWTASRSGSAS